MPEKPPGEHAIKCAEVERGGGFCDSHRPTGARKYNGCPICSRNEEFEMVTAFLETLGFSRDEEAEENLGGIQWSRPEESAWNTPDAVERAIEDVERLRDAHKKARMYGASQKERADKAEASLAELREQNATLKAQLAAREEPHA